jgi:opacity protein-like surface antigen
MSFRKLFMTGALALTVSTLAPAKASADWLFSPFIGGTFGGSAKITDIEGDDKEEFNRKLTYGASLAYLGGGFAGFEVDFGYSPNFFGSDSDDSLNLVGDGNVTTLMANVIFAAPKGPVRPYVSGGGGLLRTNVESAGGLFSDANRNDFGFDVGAGVMGFFSDNVGLRGDIRYFRAVSNDDDDSVDLNLGSFKFWRGSVGLTFRF